MEEVLVLSLHPRYTQQIMTGEKKVELRRIRPQIEPGHLILLYTISPIQAIEGILKVSRIEKKPLKDLFQEVKEISGTTKKEFFSYFQGKNEGVAIYFQDVYPFTSPLSLKEIKKNNLSFHPPQGFLYIPFIVFKKDWLPLIKERSSFCLS